MKKNQRTFLRTAAVSVAAPGLARVAAGQSARPNSYPEPVFGGPSSETSVSKEKTGLKIRQSGTLFGSPLGSNPSLLAW